VRRRAQPASVAVWSFLDSRGPRPTPYRRSVREDTISLSTRRIVVSLRNEANTALSPVGASSSVEYGRPPFFRTLRRGDLMVVKTDPVSFPSRSLIVSFVVRALVSCNISYATSTLFIFPRVEHVPPLVLASPQLLPSFPPLLLCFPLSPLSAFHCFFHPLLLSLPTPFSPSFFFLFPLSPSPLLLLSPYLLSDFYPSTFLSAFVRPAALFLSPNRNFVVPPLSGSAV